MDDGGAGLRLHISNGQKAKKGEDRLILHDEDGLTVLGVCDGHHGRAAATFVADAFVPELRKGMAGLTCSFSDDAEKAAAELRDIVAATFVSVAEQHERSKKFSGTTLTVAILIGNVLTVANIGDGHAHLDIGTETVELTVDHNLENNEAERQRLKEAGALVGRTNGALSGPVCEGERGIGKTRVWDRSGLGGLRVGRSIGRSCMARYILAHPHVRTVVLPPTGARLLLASDGLWEAVTVPKAFSLVRGTPAEAAADCLCRAAHRGQKEASRDDISVIVADFLPANAPSWPAAAAALRKSRRRGPSFGCFASPAVKDQPLERTPGLRVLGDADTWAEHVARGQAAARKILTRDDSAMQPLDGSGAGKKATAEEQQ